jgi:hypothetical protein
MWYSKNHLALEEESAALSYAKRNRSSVFQPTSSPNAHKPADPTFLTRCALGLAIGSLILAGCFALLSGGVIAIAGGLMFLLIVVCSGRPHLSTIFAQLKLKLPARSNA